MFAVRGVIGRKKGVRELVQKLAVSADAGQDARGDKVVDRVNGPLDLFARA
jgi:hypothetical protein